MVILNNFHAFPTEWQAANGETGTSVQAGAAADFLRLSREIPNALFLVNCQPRLTLELGAARMFGLSKAPLISADLVLRAPATGIEKAVVAAKKPFLRQVDLFIHYFRDNRRFAETFGLTNNRHEFVPFKVNVATNGAPPVAPGGDYVLCFGRSLRDFDTFFAAMERLPLPAAITRFDRAQLRAHHARFTRSEAELPQNVRILDDDGSEKSQIRILSNAKIVVLPILKESLVASGISSCLNAMQLGKCVIGSSGPGMSDIFDREIIAVPPEDPVALSEAIARAWQDDDLRARTAAAGHEYARKMGGEPELYQRIIDCVAAWHGCRKERKMTGSAQ